MKECLMKHVELQCKMIFDHIKIVYLIVLATHYTDQKDLAGEVISKSCLAQYFLKLHNIQSRHFLSFTQ